MVSEAYPETTVLRKECKAVVEGRSLRTAFLHAYRTHVILCPHSAVTGTRKRLPPNRRQGKHRSEAWTREGYVCWTT